MTAYLNQMLQDHWIGQRGSVSWPAHSPDLALLDFFLWGKLKGVVYKAILTTPEDMEVCIGAASAEISSEILHHLQ